MVQRTFRIIAGAALLAVLPVVAFASTSRLEGMALPGDYTKDYTAIYSWPSQITGVGNLIYGELGNNQVNPTTGIPANYERAMGAVLPTLWDGRFGTWAIHLREQTPALGQGDAMTGPNPGVGGNDPNDHQNQSFDIMWGKKFGTTSFGLRLNRSFAKGLQELPGITTSFEYDPLGLANQGTPTLARNIMGVGAGLGFEMNPSTSAEASILWENRTFSAVSSPTAKYEDNGGSTYMIAGRLMWKWQPNVMVVPVVKVYNIDLSEKASGGGGGGVADGTYDNSLRGWQAGLAGNWSLGSNDLFVLGATFARNTLDQERDVFGLTTGAQLGPYGFDGTANLKVNESLTPQVFMALESQVNSWLSLRFGANKTVWHEYKVEGTTTAGALPQTVTYKDSPFAMNLGAGVKVGSLQFDAVVDNLFYLNPLAQLQGNQQAFYWTGGGAAFEKVSVTYAW